MYNDSMKTLPQAVITLCAQLQTQGYQAVLVGGALRDQLMGIPTQDLDVATSADPAEIRSLFPHAIPIGKEFGTMGIWIDRTWIEVTPFRTEGEYRDHRHPDSVRFHATLEEDLARRDFKMNAIGYDPIQNQWHDPFKGQADIAARRISCVGDPEDRFAEDSLRLFRACRFVSQLGFELEKETQKALVKLAPTLPLPSAERMQIELKRLLDGPACEKGLTLLLKTGLLHRQLANAPDQTLDFRPEAIAKYPKEVRLAALLQKLPLSQTLAQLRLSRKETRSIRKLLHHHLDWVRAQLTPQSLSVTAADLIAIGIPVIQLSKCQAYLLDRIHANPAHNTRDSLLNLAQEWR